MAIRRRRPAKKNRPFVLGQDLQTDGHVRVTKGEAFLVHGGTARSHRETVDIVETFSDQLGKEGKADVKVAREILVDILKKKGYTPVPPDGPRKK